MFLVSIKKTSTLNKSFVLPLGELTYPLYLIHGNIGFMLFNYFGNDQNKYTLLFITISLMLVVAYLINRYYEKRVSLKLKVILLKIVKYIKLFKFRTN